MVILDDIDFINEYDLSTPFDISSKSTNYVSRCNIKSHGISIVPDDLEFSSDGMKLFTTVSDAGTNNAVNGDIVYGKNNF